MPSVKTILITGANGQLGSEFKALSTSFAQYNFLFTDKEDLPIDDIAAIKNFFEQHNISYCINCAAYTAVDKAESEKEIAYLINATAAGNLAVVCKMYNAAFIHISTDYVFDGNGARPYKESSPTSPVNEYGFTKLKGEELVLQNNPAALIIRTSWVYSCFGNNFVKTMLRLMKERESINVVSDQQGCPTYAADLATAIMQVIESAGFTKKNRPSIFNYSNEGIISWYDFAVAIKELSGSNCKVNAIPTLQYPTPAKRPHYSVMDTTLIKNTFGVTIPFWKDSLEKCLQLLQ